MKTVEFVLCSVSPVLVKREVHMYLQAIKYELWLFNDSIYEFNVLIFAFKTGNAQCRWRRQDGRVERLELTSSHKNTLNKTHVNNLTF